MINLTQYSLKSSRVTVLFVLLITVLGIVSFLNYPSREDPSITIRNAKVSVQYPGMSPERVENLLTRPIEEKIREIPEVKHIISDSKSGSSLITVILRDDVPTDQMGAVWQTLRDKMGDIAPSLPEGTRGPLINDNLGITAIATLALWADGFSLKEMEAQADWLRSQLYSLDGVQRIDIFGVQEERIYLEVSRLKLTQYGLDTRQVVDTLSKQNIILPGGQLRVDDRVLVLEPSGNFNSISELEEVVLNIPDSDQLARLGDFAEVKRQYSDPPKSPVYFNGHPALVLSVSINDGINSVAFGEQLKSRVSSLQQQLAIGYALEFATFQPELVSQAVDGAVNNLYQTLAIVLTVVMVFLGIRTGLIVGSFVPLSMLMALVIMSVLEVELQRVSIAAMIISLGMLVDNGIVVAEDIKVRIAAGIDRHQAAIQTGQTLALPLLTSSLTTILFFMPMMLAEGGAGEYTGSLAQVVTIVLLSSWFLSMTVTPVMCAWFMPIPESTPVQSNDIAPKNSGIYRRLLEQIMKRRIGFLSLILVLLGSAFYSTQYIGKEFFPLGDRNQYLIYLDLPAGTGVTTTDAEVRRLSSWLGDAEENPEVSSNVAYVSSGGPRFFLSLAPMDADPNKAFILVTSRHPDQIDTLIARTRTRLLEHYPNVRGDVKKMWMGASEAGLLEIRLTGEDTLALASEGNLLVDALNSISGIQGVKHDWGNPELKLKLNVDQTNARRLGISSEQVANAMSSYIDGVTVTKFREGDKSIPVVLRSVEAERNSFSGLQALSIYSNTAQRHVPLAQVVNITGEWQLGRIKRRDQERTLVVQAKHPLMSAEELFQTLQPSLKSIDAEPGLRWEVGGELEAQSEANGKLFSTLPLCLAAVVILLVMQFNSFRKVGIIIVTIPLVFIGVVLGLITMQALFGFMVTLGLFSLAGIIINNGIVLIDRIDQEIAEGNDRYEALLCAAEGRFRPIMLTTLTTVLGLMPLIWSQDPLFYGMASAMAFGLAMATLFTLGVVPVLYSLCFRIQPAR